jgi:dihydrofolate synthase/folylpolyglutamate synthase
MNYAETLDFLLTKLPMFSRIGAAAIKKDLTNTVLLCDALGNPQNSFKSVHIAGTNGKGSVSHMLAAIFQTAGYKTGLYTSPHLYDFRERIRINSDMVEESFVVDFTERIRPLIGKIEPSFFEITVAMAFDYFARNKVDIAIIETGLGGRLDSTNIVTPELSVITNIGYDHMNILGDSLEKIAFEKAGIIKPGVPVVIGEGLPETMPVFAAKAAAVSAEMLPAGDHFTATDWHIRPHEIAVTVANKKNGERSSWQLDLPGIYQVKNLLTVLTAVKALQKNWRITDNNMRKALQHIKKLTGFHGRWEQIRQQPAVILDVAHNEDGMRLIAEQLEITDHVQLHIVIGMVKDKEVNKVLSLLPVHARYYFTRAQIPRALPETELAVKAAAAGLTGSHYPNVNTALEDALQWAKKEDIILVCGSVFLVAEVDRELLRR